ncbi:aldolase catalytic domain-containing protein [Legionella waltersii]|uniref:4-hydroxy-2-oxovalerate aldolase n=1 Tax=Legionella waltersii TaxID=66969 RepID=A0A0W1ADS1_9GAMM|nr:aldolase catalytic domain-containing protein [Legionella waltersii]KTD79283.1 4-hydroxy-2-oxovalerate aldolase [Legionella waltersii]SNV12882.1 4-hydroxy-2-ketovalerate aldolase [Legionella waltersii]
MTLIKLLDASLRDGGHRTNFHFKDEDLKQILPPLDASGVDYIEIGYRGGSLQPIDNVGVAGVCPKEYLELCQSLVKQAKMAVMVIPGKVNADDLAELKDYNTQLLRICVAKNNVEGGIDLLEKAKSMGFETAINLIHITNYTIEELDKSVMMVSRHKPDMIYFADSNGSIFPNKITDLYSRYTHQYDIPFGFHAHDNLGLAQANAIAAIEAGARFIDASLAGMGKGTGNLKTEFFIAYLQANQVDKYNLKHVLTAANYVREALKIGHEPVSMDEFMRGIFDRSVVDCKLYK